MPTLDLVPLSPSESTSKSYKTIPLPAVLLAEDSNVVISSHSLLLEQTLGVMLHEVMHKVTTTSSLPTPVFISDRSCSPTILCSFSNVNLPSMKFDPQSSLGEIVPIILMTPLDTLLTISPHLLPLPLPPGLVQD